MAKGKVVERQRRRQILGEDLCRDVIWDILLDLYIAQEEQAEVSITSVGIAAGIPPTTVVRWLKWLAQSGYLTRRADPRDLRRTLILLAPATCERMRLCLTPSASEIDDRRAVE